MHIEIAGNNCPFLNTYLSIFSYFLPENFFFEPKLDNVRALNSKQPSPPKKIFHFLFQKYYELDIKWISDCRDMTKVLIFSGDNP